MYNFENFQNMHPDTKLTAKDATDANTHIWQIGSLRELNAMEDILDQDPAPNQGNRNET